MNTSWDTASRGAFALPQEATEWRRLLLPQSGLPPLNRVSFFHLTLFLPIFSHTLLQALGLSPPPAQLGLQQVTKCFYLTLLLTEGSSGWRSRSRTVYNASSLFLLTSKSRLHTAHKRKCPPLLAGKCCWDTSSDRKSARR